MKQWRSRAFYLEALLLLLILLLSTTVIVRVLGAARTMGVEAGQTTTASLVLQNATAGLAADTDPFTSPVRTACATGAAQTFTLAATPDGTIQSGESAGSIQNGNYVITVTLTPEAEPAGVLLAAHFEVTPPGGGASVATLDTARYCPAA